MLAWLRKTLWSEFEDRTEVTKFALLAFLFFLIIGTYWALRPVKDSIFGAMVSFERWQPYAKLLSLVITVPLVYIYGLLTDKLRRHVVFYLLLFAYAAMAVMFMIAFNDPHNGLASGASEDASRWLPWLWYVYVESFGALIVTMFWSYTTDITTPDSARRGFPFIALFGQSGNFVFPFILNTKFLGIKTSVPIIGICSVVMVLCAATLWLFRRVIPVSYRTGYHAAQVVEEKVEKGKGSFFEGLRLLFTQKYLLGIVLMVGFNNIITEIIAFHFRVMAKSAFPLEADNQAYLAQYAWMTGIVSTLCVAFGINNIQRKLGMQASLVLLPILMGMAIGSIWFTHDWPQSLSVVFWIVVLSKAVNYALNQPSIRQLYIPTSKDTKYKAQAWISMFGSRSAKMLGSGVNGSRFLFKGFFGGAAGVSVFLTAVTGMSMAMVAVWVMVGCWVGQTYNQAIEEDKVVC